METTFIAADLHVHTPASKCYQGNTDESEYLEILKNYYSKKINIVAITDHNTISGYKKLMEIKKHIYAQKEIIETYAKDHPSLLSELEKLSENVNIFEKMLILPGVEFEANPGIHLLFIFNPEQDLNEIDAFLLESGYSATEQGNEKITSVNIDVLDAIAKAKKLRSITIAAHVDSDKGIYNSLEKGQYRARIFSSDNLDGISVNNPTNIEKIKNLLTNQEYARTRPLAMIQSSDHHHPRDCGKIFSFFKMEKLNFHSLNQCFKDPNEYISNTEKPEIVSIIKKTASDFNTVCYETIDQVELTKAICATLNNKYGTILIGVTNDRYYILKGTSLQKNDIEIMIEQFKNDLPDARYSSKFEIIEYPLNGKNIHSIKVENISNNIFQVEKNYHFISDRRIITNDVTVSIKKIEGYLKNSFEEFHNKIDENIEEIHKKLSLLLTTRQNYKVIEIVESDSVILSKITSMRLVFKNVEKKPSNVLHHGTIDDAVYYIENVPQRDENVYLRITCPCTNDYPLDQCKDILYGEYMVIGSQGVTHYINNDNFAVINSTPNRPILVVSFESQYKDYFNLKVLTAWTKSSLFLYYMFCKAGENNLYFPSVYNTIHLPMRIFDEEIKSAIVSLVDKIIELERQFLKSEILLLQQSRTEAIDEIIFDNAKNHNESVDIIADEIDSLIYQTLEVDANTINAVEKFLEYSNMHSLEIT